MNWGVESDCGVLGPTDTGTVASDSASGTRDGKRTQYTFVDELLPQTFFERMTELRRCDLLCDVVLVASVASTSYETESERPTPITIAAHKVVLSSASPYFCAMFTRGMMEQNSDKVELKNVDGSSLSTLVDYMYSGRLEITVSTVQSLLVTSSMLQLNSARDACSRFLLEQLEVSNCLGIAEFAAIHNCAQLAHAAHVFTQQHFRELLGSEELLQLDFDRFLGLISDDRLTTKGEEGVYTAVIEWIRYDQTRERYLSRLLSEVRLPLLSQDFLLDNVSCEPMVKMNAECKDLLLEAYKYHMRKDCIASTRWTRPRQPMPMSKLIVLVGGQAPKAIANVDTLDSDSHRWSSLSSLPQRRCRSGVGVVGDLIYAIGGFNGSQRVRTVDVYDAKRDIWLSGPPMEFRRSTLGVAVVDNSVLVATGGFDGSNGLSSAEMLDPRRGTWEPLPPMSVRRSSVGVCAIGQNVYAVGGYDGQTRQCLSTVEILDMRALRWRSAPSLQEVRSGAAVTCWGEQIVAAGGHDGPLVRSTVEILRDDMWESLPDMRVCRRNAGLVAANGALYVLGGDDGVSNLSTVEHLNLQNGGHGGWTFLETELPQARSYSGLALLNKVHIQMSRVELVDGPSGSRIQIKDEPLSEEEVEIEEIEETDENGVELLEYEQNVMVDTLTDDVLFVTASGLGIERLFCNYLIMYSDPKSLVLVLNTTQQDEAFYLSKLKECSVVECQPKLINSDVSVSDRLALYLQGGVQFITSRILLVDLLTNRIPVKHVAGIFVYRAHQVLNSFQESFIVRLFREKKKGGFVKAFTDVPTLLSSLGQLQRLVDRLYVRRIRLIPRFDEDVRRTLEKSPPKCAEIFVDLPAGMRRVLSILMDLLKVCMRELKQASTGMKVEEEEDAFNAVVYGSTELERRLNAKRSFLGDRQQRLLSDVELLRHLLRMAEDMDMCTLLARINSLKSDQEAVENSSGWMQTPTAIRMSEQVRALANTGDNTPEFVAPPKWSVLQTVIEEVKDVEVCVDDLPPQGACVFIFVSDEFVSRQISDLIKKGVARLKGDLKRALRPVATDPPLAPLWSVDQVIPFMRNDVGGNHANRKELVSDVQKNQKQTARVAKKRQKVAEQLVKGDKQTTIMQFGVMEYKRRRKTTVIVEEDEPGPSTTVDDVKEETDEKDETVKVVMKIRDCEKCPLIILPHGERYNTLRALETYQPVAVIMYNMDIVTLRQVEVFHACNSTRPLYFYSLQYNESSEEGRYLSRLNREQTAFDSLRRESENLMTGIEYETIREDAPRIVISTRQGGGYEEERKEPPKIVVDMREFNSELPTILYKKGYDVIAATIEVGDYVLSPGICVERKALDDLTQSLQSGRVFKQTEQMLRNYSASVLLIESNIKFELKIVNGGPFQGELSRHCREIRSQLCCLLRSHPKLKLLWSLSPENSAEYFAELKLNADDPDVEKAVALKGDDAEAEAESIVRGKGNRPNGVILRNLTQNLPGMNRMDIQRLMVGGQVANLKELMTSSIDKLQTTVGEEHVDKLSLLFGFDFLQRVD